MEINLKEIKFDKAVDVTWIIFTIIAFPISLWLIVDFNFFLKADIFKILLSTICSGAAVLMFLYIVASVLTAFLNKPHRDEDESDSNIEVFLAVILQNICFGIGLLTIVVEKFILNYHSQYLLRNFLVCYSIAFTTLFLVLIIWIIIINKINKEIKSRKKPAR